MTNPIRQFSDLLLEPDATIREALQVIDRFSASNVFVVGEKRRFLGTVADCDIRRALLQGIALDNPLTPLVAKSPAAIGEEVGRAEALDLMHALKVREAPIVDSEGVVTGIHFEHEVLGTPALPNWAVIMAGGKGTRLGSLTKDTPKPMLPVAGRPILERLVLHLVGAGIRQIFISVNYLAEQIEKHFGDGSQFGCVIEYLREETDRPLGTGGALSLLGDLGYQPDKPILVMNGDLITDFSVSQLLAAHGARDVLGTIAVTEYRHEVPFGVLESRDGKLTGVVEKPTAAWPVNAGIYALEPKLLELIPRNEMFPITRLFDECLKRNWPIGLWRVGEWLDIGRPAELALARGEVV
ncbi:nucleotidyltransferase family protein [Amycolatopsis sacchari]|uniref:nucleotidyltransferase family protein n=1 Tax=Amycolatopsis sacchari TaxID=115433 RepID=UPI003D7426A9